MKKAVLFIFAALSCLLCTPVQAAPLTEEPAAIKVYNWGEYISDGSEGTLNTIKEFEARFPNISVTYDVFATNEEMYAKMKSGSAQYDVIFPSDYMVSRLISEGMLEELDMKNIPNSADISPEFLHPDYDPENLYSVPYTWGTVGIIYNTTMVDEPVDSWEILWNEQYRNSILMFDNSRDAFGISLKLLGYSQNTTDRAELAEASEKLIEQKPLLQAYVMDQIFDKMTGGEAALAPYYAGDALIMMEENPDLDFAVPKEGTNLFIDAMVIPKGTRAKWAAETFINFMLEPDIAYENIDFIGYSTPMLSVKEMMDEEVLEDGISYPSEEVLQNCDSFVNLPEDINLYLQELWDGVKTAGVSSVWELVFLVTVIVGVGAFFIVYLRRRRS